jgi:hypothetical protein
MQNIDISDLECLKRSLELEERGFDVAISNAFHGKRFYLYFNVINYHLIQNLYSAPGIDGSVVTHVTEVYVPASSTHQLSRATK